MKVGNMVSITDVDQQKLVEKAAEELKKSMKQPEWSRFVKTGMSRERPPEQKDWWFLRAASILRNVSLNGPIGTSRLRSYYGGRQRQGHQPPRFAKSSGKIIRVLLKELEEKGFVKKTDKPRKGRIVTSQGQKLLSAAAKHAK